MIVFIEMMSACILHWSVEGKSRNDLSGWDYGRVCLPVSGDWLHCVIPYGR